MRMLSKEEVEIHRLQTTEEVRNGAVFIHPTDTIYGIGCDATNESAVQRIRGIKSRFKLPFSVIAPSKEWITKNCVITKKVEDWIEKLPGPYTFILKLKNKKAIAESTNYGMDTIGVRIPDHWFSGFVRELGVPCITTSANRVGDNYMTKMEDLNPEIKAKVDFIIYEGPKTGRPSQLINFEKEEVEIKTR